MHARVGPIDPARIPAPGAALARQAAQRVRGPIGASASVGPNGAPGIAGQARQNAARAARIALDAIGRHVDAHA